MSTSRDEESYRLWRARRTLCQMLRDRGYVVEHSDLDMKYETFLETFSNKTTDMRQQSVSAAARYEGVSRRQLGLVSNLQSDPSEGIFVFFSEDESIGVEEIRRVHGQMKENSVFRAIIVEQTPPAGSSKKGLLPSAKKAIDSLNHSDPTKPLRYIIEVFKEAELLVNITEHVLVPLHVPLSEEETAALLSRYKLKPTQLPRMKYTDAVARYYGMQKGQVVKIIRPSETAGRYVTYRLVV